MRLGRPVRLLAAAWFLAAPPALLPPCWAAQAVVDWDEPYVNVRAAPGIEATKVGRLARGAEGEVLEEQGEWVRLRYPGGEGWVVERSLRRLPDPVQAVAAPVPAPPEPAAAEPAASPAPPAPGGVTEPTPVATAESVPAPQAAPAAPPPTPVTPPAPPREGYLSGLDQTPAPPIDPGSGLVSLLSGLLLVLALLAGVVWLVRRFAGHRFPGGRRGNAIRVLATRALGPRQGLLLAEAGGLVWLLGQGPDGVRLLAEIRDETALRRLNEQYGFLDTPFEAQLRRQLDLETDGAGPTPDREPSPEERLAALRRRPKPGEPS